MFSESLPQPKTPSDRVLRRLRFNNGRNLDRLEAMLIHVLYEYAFTVYKEHGIVAAFLENMREAESGVETRVLRRKQESDVVMFFQTELLTRH
ncbi:hypothetical protein PROAA_1980008 [Candidatus Propionivibrio aalborgensis]|uniref:Uncharacterized protein n=1 Tax=Candidatus Propionivibrio aalborgensis TaxID=1860101 RepID=A0A1A8XS92_9RHOO|nr:hypothetical protein PROAA_1980008 [Candidatus Propionivibrio aalborgensis]